MNEGLPIVGVLPNRFESVCDWIDALRNLDIERGRFQIKSAHIQIALVIYDYSDGEVL